ncbi:MAG: hypothetical protein C0624_05945 [Desulfuromonas sp.]|nr:MAG: hypothetical protein C0624_05945 [Desulfuromonas sp.]
MSLDLLQQILPWFNRGLWLVGGLLCGVIAAHWLALGLDDVQGPPPVASVQGKADVRKSEQLSDFSVILERNLFGVAPGVLTDGGREPPPGADVAVSTQAPADLTLLGTVAGGEHPLALLRVGSELLLVRQGDEISAGRTLEEVRRSEVTVRQRDGSVAVIPLQEGSTLASRAMPSTPPPKAGATRHPQIEKVGENRWRIPREEAEKARTNLNSLLKTARMTPNIVDGRTEGFQVVMIQPRSLLSQMGLRPRDVLKEINGVELDSPEKALQVFYQLREARSLSLSLVRNDEPLTFDYVVE